MSVSSTISPAMVCAARTSATVSSPPPVLPVVDVAESTAVRSRAGPGGMISGCLARRSAALRSAPQRR